MTQHKERVTSSNLMFSNYRIRLLVNLLKMSQHDFICLNKAVKCLGIKEALYIKNKVDLLIIEAFTRSLSTNIIAISIIATATSEHGF